jgi:hypothetical protein
MNEAQRKRIDKSFEQLTAIQEVIQEKLHGLAESAKGLTEAIKNFRQVMTRFPGNGKPFKKFQPK